MVAMNTERRWKRGDIGPDGRVFYRYNKGYKNGERWVTGDQFRRYVSKDKIRNKKNTSTPSYKDKWREYTQKPEIKAYRKEYHRLHGKKYKMQPKYKEWQRKYKQGLRRQCEARSYMTALLAVKSLSALKQQPETEP